MGSTGGRRHASRGRLPRFSVRDSVRAVAIDTAAFGAQQGCRVDTPDGAMVARLSMGGADCWVSDESPDQGTFSPQTLGGGTVRMIVTVADPDAWVAPTVLAGALVVAIEEAHGWRRGRVVAPFGHHWEIGRPLDTSRSDARSMRRYADG